MVSYCGSEFNKNPPKEVPHAVSDRIDVTSAGKQTHTEIYSYTKAIHLFESLYANYINRNKPRDFPDETC